MLPSDLLLPTQNESFFTSLIQTHWEVVHCPPAETYFVFLPFWFNTDGKILQTVGCFKMFTKFLPKTQVSHINKMKRWSPYFAAALLEGMHYHPIVNIFVIILGSPITSSQNWHQYFEIYINVCTGRGKWRKIIFHEIRWMGVLNKVVFKLIRMWENNFRHIRPRISLIMYQIISSILFTMM